MSERWKKELTGSFCGGGGGGGGDGDLGGGEGGRRFTATSISNTPSKLTA